MDDPTMSSREIATLCDKEHRNVPADIRTMCEQLNLDVSKFGGIYTDSMNRISEYDFVENQDFVCFHKKMEADNATMVEYYITLDMAKNSVG